MEKLTDLQQVVLLLVKNGRSEELHSNWTNQVKSLLDLDLIQLRPNKENEYMLTIKGQDSIAKKILVKYPMHVKGNIGTYDDVMKTISDNAFNALICSAMNNRVFDRLSKDTARTLGQHFLDIMFYKKWGSHLIGKWQDTTKKSLAFFDKMNRKYAGKDKAET